MSICVGIEINGFCGGWFGRDSYGDRRIEAFGVDWIVTRSDDRVVELVDFADQAARDAFVVKYGGVRAGDSCDY